ncbi:MAG: methyltransferase MtaB domain-containing protein [Candidatus Heimdallarchaeota archaeon]
MDIVKDLRENLVQGKKVQVEELTNQALKKGLSPEEILNEGLIAGMDIVGNIAAAVCDLWSNESVQNTRLLSGYAPEVFSEILAYDCRLMNESIKNGSQKSLQKSLIGCDEFNSVQALIISPKSSFEIAKGIIKENRDFARVHRAGSRSCQIIRDAIDNHLLDVSEREKKWLDIIQDDLSRYSAEEALLDHSLACYSHTIQTEDYGIEKL